tara:strand:+ start:1271 stop:1762 length:492 start_codon:yes stop_codon:yes gene_type:complete
MIKRFLFLFTIIYGISCQSDISHAEKIILSAERFLDYQNKLEIFERAAKKSSSDSLWVRYKMASADLQAQIPGRALFSIRNYMQVYDSVPNRQEAPISLLSAAIVFEEELNDQIRSLKTIKVLLDNYPNTKIAFRAEKYRDLVAMGNDSLVLEKIHTWQLKNN